MTGRRVSKLEPQNETGRLGSTHTDTAYDTKQILILEDLGAVRKRPGVCTGSTGKYGLHHLIYKIVGNTVDEALAGYCDQIGVALLDSGGVRVADSSRGIPAREYPVEKTSTVTLVLTILHVGGKFGDGGYRVPGGLHGAGSSVVSALSKGFTVEVSRDSHRYVQASELGVSRYDLQELEKVENTGTTVTFYPNPEIFEATVFNYETLATRLREMAFPNEGFRLTLTDLHAINREGGDSEEERHHDLFRLEHDLINYVCYLLQSKGPIHPSVVNVESHDDAQDISLETAM